MRAPGLALAGWTIFVWATRIRNALRDGELHGFSRVFALSVAILFTLGALLVLASVLRRAHAVAPLAVLAAATVVYWPVRIVQIAANGHPVGFTVVHAALGAISIALAVWAWPFRARAHRRAGVLSSH